MRDDQPPASACLALHRLQLHLGRHLRQRPVLAVIERLGHLVVPLAAKRTRAIGIDLAISVIEAERAVVPHLAAGQYVLKVVLKRRGTLDQHLLGVADEEHRLGRVRLEELHRCVADGLRERVQRHLLDVHELLAHGLGQRIPRGHGTRQGQLTIAVKVVHVLSSGLLARRRGLRRVCYELVIRRPLLAASRDLLCLGQLLPSLPR